MRISVAYVQKTLPKIIQVKFLVFIEEIFNREFQWTLHYIVINAFVVRNISDTITHKSKKSKQNIMILQNQTRAINKAYN